MSSVNSKSSAEQVVTISTVEKPTGINKLPIDLLRSIHSFSGATELRTQSLVSKTWNSVSYKPKLWEEYAKKLNIPIKNHETVREEVLAHGAVAKLPKVNSLLQKYFSAKNIHIQVNKVSERSKSLKEVFWDKIKSYSPVGPTLTMDEHFELNLRIRNFIRKNISNEKYKVIFDSVAQEICDELDRNWYTISKSDGMEVGIKALQLLIDEGLRISIPGTVMLDFFRCFAIQPNSERMKKIIEESINKIIEKSFSGDFTDYLKCVVDNLNRDFGVEVLNRTYNIKGDRLLRLLFPYLTNLGRDYLYNKREELADAFIEFVGSKLQGCNKQELKAELDAFEQQEINRIRNLPATPIFSGNSIPDLQSNVEKLRNFLK